MDQLRKEAREALQRNPWKRPDFLRAAWTAVAQRGLPELWEDVSSHDSTTHQDVCESLYTAFCFVDAWDPLLPNDGGPKNLNETEAQAVRNLFKWASQLALPSPAFAAGFDEHAETTEETPKKQEESRLRSELAIQLILQLSAKAILGLTDRSVAGSPDVVLAAACFTSEKDPWTTSDSHAEASMHLDVTLQYGQWVIIEQLLKEKIRPLFTKAKNPAITSEGRKNFHPVPLSRFDGSTLDDEMKPWKNSDIYATRPTDKVHLEAQFPLLVPAILALIDDNSITFKKIGCELFSKLLKTIHRSNSDILVRTNLTSVFEDAITPCLLSLPTITPEDSSMQLLGAAYPTLLSLFQTVYKTPTPKKTKDQNEKDKETYAAKLTTILRSNLISSFHHISSSTPAAISTSASFPHPRLSTFLLEWIATFVKELGIKTTKYLQDIIPILYTTLSNPFGTAHLPLLSAAVSATKVVILNAHPRIWRWRGEILGGLSACWLHIVAEQKEKVKDSPSVAELLKIRRELQSAVFLLKHALQNPVAVVNDVPDADQMLAKESMQQEVKELVEADSELEGLLLADVKS
ncbi:uncharacterized protein N7482_006648 [Penicillium canariense]|uniref:Uncharacterized protein n=1 Tax=Penicillium canariense TaxID=189055 RepID=A0A9W9HV71_9EURO|nr:uncharacterized protein N7482_006648 [Penicillium canariense]KAJ5159644.1 hypothetical protein N7482_006648 [Penicillium canariense]